MRLCDTMKPARSYEEAAMVSARTVTGGAALRMVQCMQPDENVRTLEVSADQTQQKAACCASESNQAIAMQNRAALYHVIRHSF